MRKLEDEFRFMAAALQRDERAAQTLPDQITLIIRYLIATNAIKAGAKLPPLRAAASAAGVNLHTMREAYRRLQSEGYLDVIPSVGARISKDMMGFAAASGAHSLDEFLDRTEREARTRFGLDRDDLAALFSERARAARAADVNFIECSLGQAAMHAEQVETILGRPCAPIVIRDDAPAPEGFSVTTLFHLDEIERIWPGKRRDLHYVHIGVSPAMKTAINEAAPADGEIIIGEKDTAVGERMADELAHLTGRKRALFRVENVNGCADLFARGRNQPIFVPPRIWNRLPEAVTAQPNVRHIRYDIDKDDAAALAAKFKRYSAALEAK